MWVNAYAICSAPTDTALIEAIHQRVAALKHDYPNAMIVGVSHDVLTQPTGAFLWTALITCEYHSNTEPPKLYNQEEDNDKSTESH
jgi:hypothetical protein